MFDNIQNPHQKDNKLTNNSEKKTNRQNFNKTKNVICLFTY